MGKWTTCRLEEIIQVNPTVKLTKGEVYPFIDIDKVSPTLRSVTNEEEKVYDGQSCSKFCNGDTVFSRITPCLENRKIAKVSIDGQVAFGSTEFYIFRAKDEKSDEDFVYYLTSSDAVVLPAINSMTGASGRQRADRRFIERTKLNVPDLPTQERIADILSAYDDLIENNNRRIALLEKAAQELYKEWFVRFRFPGYKTAKFENGLPAGWDVRRVGDISKIGSGGDAPKDYSPVRTVEYSVPIFSNGITNDGLYGFAKKGTKQAKSITISARGTVGFTCLRFETYLPIVRLLSIEPDSKKIDVYYLYHNLRNDIIDGYGTSQQQITIPFFSRKKIVVPPISLQNQYSAIVEEIFNQINKLKETNKNLAEQRDLLLPRLMSGKLEV